MDVNDVMNQNFVYRMVSKIFIDFLPNVHYYFYVTCFTHRHSLILPNLCIYTHCIMCVCHMSLKDLLT